MSKILEWILQMIYVMYVSKILELYLFADDTNILCIGDNIDILCKNCLCGTR